MEKINQLTKAAEQGDINAMYELAEHYGREEYNYALAGDWYALAARDGHVDAMRALYDLYCWHDFKDGLEKARRFAKIAADAGSAEAKKLLDEIGGMIKKADLSQTENKVSTEEKMDCLPLIGTILELNDIARTKGLLALEDLIPTLGNSGLQIAVRLIVDAIDPEDIKSIMDAYTVSIAKTEAAALRCTIVIQGVLMIQGGTDTESIKEKLCAFLGEDYFRFLDENDEGYLLDTEVENDTDGDEMIV
jgi:hypothetical protein